MRTNPHVVSARVSSDTFRRIQYLSAARRLPVSTIIQHAIASLKIASDSNAKPPAAWVAVADVLGIPADRVDEILAALEELIDEAIAALPAAAPTGEGADAPPKALSANELALCAKHGVDPKVFAFRKANAVTRTPAPKRAPAPAPYVTRLSIDERQAAFTRGISPEEALARKSNAVRRRAK